MTSEPTRLLMFDVSGEYAHFRKFNTTTSPLTYTIPTRPALAGMLGAIMGIEREVAPGKFPPGVVPTQEVFAKAHCGIAVGLLAPPRRTVMGFNLLDTDSKRSFFEIKMRTQIAFELLKEPRFRVFVSHADNGYLDTLAERLRTRRHHFTPYLGLSQFTATLEYVAEVQATPRRAEQPDFQPMATAVNLNQVQAAQPVDFSAGGAYLTETMPISMTRDRVVTEYAEVLMESQGKPLAVKAAQWLDAGTYGNVMFL